MAHVSVLLHEVLELLHPQHGEFAIDGTADGGGHSAAMLAAVGERGKLLSVDLDPEMAHGLAQRFSKFPNALVRESNYADIPAILEKEKLPSADVFLLDLGFSSNQLEAGRGFAFESDEPLRMTYSPETPSVRDVIRQLTESELADVIYEFGEERYSRRIAAGIKERLKKGPPIETAKDLSDTIKSSVSRSYERGRIHPATRTFQALRIFANDELGNLKKILDAIPSMMRSGGRVGIISFHSLEDRIVKNAFRDMQKEKKAEIITKKPVTASEQEIGENPRSRSAKLRCIRIL